MGLGGKRPGAGKPKGYKHARTLEREAVKKLFDQRVLKTFGPLMNAQISLATGIQYLYKIEKERVVGPKGGISYRNMKPEIVTDPNEIEQYLTDLSSGSLDDDRDGEATYYYITTEKPENMAIDSMWNRLWGKPKETVDVNNTITLSLIDIAEEARKRRMIDGNKDVRIIEHNDQG